MKINKIITRIKRDLKKEYPDGIEKLNINSGFRLEKLKEMLTVWASSPYAWVRIHILDKQHEEEYTDELSYRGFLDHPEHRPIKENIKMKVRRKRRNTRELVNELYNPLYKDYGKEGAKEIINQICSKNKESLKGFELSKFIKQLERKEGGKEKPYPTLRELIIWAFTEKQKEAGRHAWPKSEIGKALKMSQTQVGKILKDTVKKYASDELERFIRIGGKFRKFLRIDGKDAHMDAFDHIDSSKDMDYINKITSL